MSKPNVVIQQNALACEQLAAKSKDIFSQTESMQNPIACFKVLSGSYSIIIRSGSNFGGVASHVPSSLLNENFRK